MYLLDKMSNSLDNKLEKLKRPEILDADIIRFYNQNEKWIAFIGLKYGKPYEIFTGISDSDTLPIPKTIEKGKIVKVKENGKSRYDFQYTDKYGYINTMGGLSHKFNREFWNYARFVSAMLRGGLDIEYIIETVSKLDQGTEGIETWKTGVIMALQNYLPK